MSKATKNYHRVMGKDGFAIYRASPKTYVSYNIDKDSFSTKMLPGNVPVEIVPAPKVIKVRGEAWGVKVTRTYLEGERPIVCTYAFHGCGPRFSWELAKAAGKDSVTMEEQKQFMTPANPDYVSFSNYGYTEANRKACVETVADIAASIAKRKAGTLEKWSGGYDVDEVALVELR